ncbi:MAG: DUF5696 domain-containing protein [Candidatus Aminicenantes bacterium]|nr:DUF5696 domain-containing protein [Candidatus Aminicenantes bacterium]
MRGKIAWINIRNSLLSLSLPFLVFSSLRGIDFPITIKGATIVYRYLPSTGTLHDLEVIISQSLAFRPCNFGGITSFFLGGQLLHAWEERYQREFLGSIYDERGYYVARFRWSRDGESFDFLLKLKLEGKTLIIEAEVISPFSKVITFSTDRSEATPDPKIIDLPFGHPVLYSQGYFISAVLDPFYSNSSWLSPICQPVSANSAVCGYVAWYFPRSDGQRNLLRERLLITVSPEIEDTFYIPPLAVSPFREDLARRVVVDLWLDSFQKQEDFLRWLASFNFKDFLVLLHCWQKYGYDNGLPSTYPASEMYGGHESLKKLARFCHQLGYRFGLHTNYVDFYPNSDVWNPDDVALDSQGKMVLSWFNAYLGLQSYLLKPTKAISYAWLYEPLIHENYETSAAFLDVHTAILPSFKVDFDAQIFEAGRQISTFLAYRELIGLMQQIHNGPVAGEGYGYSANIWAGYIDSFEANPASIYSLDKGLKPFFIPCIPNYKLKVLHHRFVPFGLGLLERFFPETRSISAEHFQYYRATEIAFGQAGYIQLSPEIQLIPEEILREYCFLKHIQPRYLLASAKQILYEINGEFLTLSESLSRLLPFCPGPNPENFLLTKLARLKIEYDNGLLIYINRSLNEPWDIQVDQNIYTLPPGGFLAKQEDSFLAYTAIVSGIKKYFLQPAEPPCRGNLQELILAPLNLRGEKRENRSLFMKEYINILYWEPNPVNKNIQGYRIYREEKGEKKLIGEVGASSFIFFDRGVIKEKEYTYYVTAFNSDDREGQMARVEIR